MRIFSFYSCDGVGRRLLSIIFFLLWLICLFLGLLIICEVKNWKKKHSIYPFLLLAPSVLYLHVSFICLPIEFVVDNVVDVGVAAIDSDGVVGPADCGPGVKPG